MLAYSIIGLLVCSLQLIFADAQFEAKGRRCSSSSSSSDVDCRWCHKHGPKGPRGDPGPQGYQGITGLKGETGPIGEQGEDGPATANEGLFIVNYDGPFITNTTNQAYPFSYVTFITPGFETDLSTIVIKEAGTYSFVWHTNSTDLITNYLSFNDTVTGDAPNSASVFNMFQSVGLLWGQAIFTTANNYTSLMLIIAQNGLTVQNASLFIRKLY